MKGEESTILRSSNGRRKDGDGGKQGGGNVEVANATMCKGHQEIPGAGKLL